MDVLALISAQEGQRNLRKTLSIPNRIEMIVRERKRERGKKREKKKERKAKYNNETKEERKKERKKERNNDTTKRPFASGPCRTRGRWRGCGEWG